MWELEELFRQYKSDVYHYLLSLTHDAAQAEDLLSDTFLGALQGLGRFKGKSSIKTWLLGIARNMWLQSLRKQRDTVEYSDLLGLYMEEETLAKNLDAKELAACVEGLLGQKNDKTQRVMRMRIEGYSYREIALACGASENSVRVMEFRTRKWLRECLQKEGYL